MLNIKGKSKSPTRLVLGAAVVIGLAIMGDSLMYSLLPLEAEALGIPIGFVGLLLSINRLVRLGTNTWAGIIFEKLGPRRPFILASVVAIITTLVYGLGWGLSAFLVARAGWGMAWSLFRQGGYVAVWTDKGDARGRLMGLLWGIVRVGSAISVLLGGLLYDRYGYNAAVMVILGITTLGLPASLAMGWPETQIKDKPVARSGSWKEVLQLKDQRWLLGVGFAETFFESVLLSTASLFLAAKLRDEFGILGYSIGTTAGVLLALRFSANILFGPLIGSISDRLGRSTSISLLATIILLGLSGTIFLSDIWVAVSLAIVFISSSGLFVTVNAAASEKSERSSRPHIFVGFFNTAIDAGAAAGPLFVYSSAAILQSLESVYLLAALALFAVIQRYVWIEGRKTSFDTIKGKKS